MVIPFTSWLSLRKKMQHFVYNDLSEERQRAVKTKDKERLLRKLAQNVDTTLFIPKRTPRTRPGGKGIPKGYKFEKPYNYVKGEL